MYMTVSWAFAVNIPAITEEYLVVFFLPVTAWDGQLILNSLLTKFEVVGY